MIIYKTHIFLWPAKMCKIYHTGLVQKSLEITDLVKSSKIKLLNFKLRDFGSFGNLSK